MEYKLVLTTTDELKITFHFEFLDYALDTIREYKQADTLRSYKVYKTTWEEITLREEI